MKQEPKSLQKALEQKEQLEARIANERSKYAADLRIPYRLRRAWQKNREPDRALIKSVTEVTIMANPKDSTGRKFFDSRIVIMSRERTISQNLFAYIFLNPLRSILFH